MKTKFTMANGDVHIVDGKPQDFVLMLGEISTMNERELEIQPGNVVKIKDIAEMNGYQ